MNGSVTERCYNSLKLKHKGDLIMTDLMYLLRGLAINRTNKVWASDIALISSRDFNATFIPHPQSAFFYKTK